MTIGNAGAGDLDASVACLAAAFAHDPITGFLLETGPGYGERLRQFFSLLMRARLALQAPMLVARGGAGILCAAMGYGAVRSPWPPALAEEWDCFEAADAGLSERMAAYDEIAAEGLPGVPHDYLGVIGVAPASRGQGIGMALLESFCARSAADRLSGGVYLETANAANLRFYERAGFSETARGRLGKSTLWCLYRQHRR